MNMVAISEVLVGLWVWAVVVFLEDFQGVMGVVGWLLWVVVRVGFLRVMVMVGFLVGCSSARVTSGQDGSSARDGWSLVAKAAIISSILLASLSPISCHLTLRELNSFAIRSSLWSSMSQRSSDTKLLWFSLKGDGRWIIELVGACNSRVFEVLEAS
jgi:hypothetical protein